MVEEERAAMPVAGKVLEIRAQWDVDAGVWWCSNDELPLTTEAPSFEQLVARVMEIVPEIAGINGFAKPGEIVSRHTANGVLKDAGLPKAF